MRPANPPEGYLFSKGTTLAIFILLWLLYFFDYVDRLVVVSLFPFLKADWGLTDAQCGALVSAVYWAILIFTFPTSILIDRWSRKKSIGLMAVLWSIATAACAFTRSFGQLFAARAVIGLGEAGYAPGGTAMISALYPERRRAFMIGIWNISIPIGMAVGITAGAAIAERWGWRHAFGIVALPGLAVAVLFFFVRDYRTVALGRRAGAAAAGPAAAGGKRRAAEIAAEFWRTPSLLFTFLGFAGMMYVSTAFSTFLPTYFQRVQGLGLQPATFRTSLIMLVCIVGSPLGGFLADLWMKRRLEARLLVAAGSAALTALFYLAGFSLFTGGAVQYALFLLGGVTTIGYASSAIAVTQDVVHPGLRAVSYALCVVTQHLLGSAVGPIATGAISDRFGILPAMQTAAAMCLLSCIFFLIGSRFYGRDLAKVERVAIEPET
jgi:predicted MFS family arabinose efflux permease